MVNTSFVRVFSFHLYWLHVCTCFFSKSFTSVASNKFRRSLTVMQLSLISHGIFLASNFVFFLRVLNCVFKDSNGRYIVLNINFISCSFQACFFILLELLNQIAQWLLNIFTRISYNMRNEKRSLYVAHFIDSGYCLVIPSFGCPN